MGLTRDEIYQAVRAALLDVTGADIDDFDCSAGFAEIEVDSLDLVETAIVLEERTGLLIVLESFEDITTIEALIGGLDHLAKRAE